MLNIAVEYASVHSNDPRTKVGAVIVVDGTIVSMGSNVMPMDIVWTEEMMKDRAWKNSLIIHAEVNAIAGKDVAGGTAYVTHHPCKGCAQKLVDAGIVTVVIPDVPPTEGWEQSQLEAAQVMTSQGITIVRI